MWEGAVHRAQPDFGVRDPEAKVRLCKLLVFLRYKIVTPGRFLCQLNAIFFFKVFSKHSINFN